jgi:hypothetical protein
MNADTDMNYKMRALAQGLDKVSPEDSLGSTWKAAVTGYGSQVPDAPYAVAVYRFGSGALAATIGNLGHISRKTGNEPFCESGASGAIATFTISSH